MKRIRSLVTCSALVLTLVSTVHAQVPVLDVEDDQGSSLFQVNTDGTLALPTGATDGFVLTADANGLASWQAAPGLTLPFSGTWDFLSPAFTLEKTAAAEVLSLSSTAGGPLIVGTMTGGVPLSMAMVISSSNGGIQPEAGDGWALNASNNSTLPTIQAVNNGEGLVGRFVGDVEVEGDLLVDGAVDCTDCIDGNAVADGTITAADVDPGSGFYVSRGQLYTESATFGVLAGTSGNGAAACQDLNDLPLAGSCTLPSTGEVSLRGLRTKNWLALDELAEYECTVTNNTDSTIEATVFITCLDVN